MFESKIDLLFTRPLLAVRTCLFGLFAVVIGGCLGGKGTLPTNQAVIEGKPRNIILMIGDGMGLTQVTAGAIERKRFQLTNLPYVGFHKPYSASNLITDSAAGATAFACGVKTFNRGIGLAVDSSRCTTLLEEAKAFGCATGIVVSSTIVHATPASFYAHQPSRQLYEEIALDLLAADLDLFVGGGQKFFTQRSDNRNLVKELLFRQYQVGSYFEGALQRFSISTKRPVAYFSAFDSPLPAGQGRDYLPFATELAANFLDRRSDNGFFLLVEGSQIDWGGHAKNADYILEELLDFDRAVGRAISFARRDGETLVIVTADHETGGMALNQDTTKLRVAPQFTVNNHTGTMVPVFAYGPSADQFQGIYENTEIYRKIMKLVEWKKNTLSSEGTEGFVPDEFKGY